MAHRNGAAAGVRRTGFIGWLSIGMGVALGALLITATLAGRIEDRSTPGYSAAE